MIRAIPTADGVLSWEEVNRLIRPVNPYSAPTGLVALENTHNMHGGTVYPMHTVREICDGTLELQAARLRMDGARIFSRQRRCKGFGGGNRRPPACRRVFCLSKALGAPAGSLLAGTAEKIDKGRLYRKRLGGGMRQVGVLAAAGLVALEESPRRNSA